MTTRDGSVMLRACLAQPNRALARSTSRSASTRPWSRASTRCCRSTSCPDAHRTGRMRCARLSTPASKLRSAGPVDGRRADVDGPGRGCCPRRHDQRRRGHCRVSFADAAPCRAGFSRARGVARCRHGQLDLVRGARRPRARGRSPLQLGADVRGEVDGVRATPAPRRPHLGRPGDRHGRHRGAHHQFDLVRRVRTPASISLAEFLPDLVREGEVARRRDAIGGTAHGSTPGGRWAHASGLVPGESDVETADGDGLRRPHSRSSATVMHHPPAAWGGAEGRRSAPEGRSASTR